MFIKCLKVGQMETNCYILCDKVENRAAVIDPGYDAARIAGALEDTQCFPEYMILTHAHFDHIAAVQELGKKTGAKLVVLEDELALLNDPVKNLYSSFKTEPFRPFDPEFLMHEGDTLKLGLLELRFLHTPGHTQGSCCILCQDVLFTGDTLFRENVGRTDLPTGSMQALLSSVKRLAALDGEYQVFPGHGDITAMSHERQFNPYITSGEKDA
jgi:hydroxyacylglutathione hydrolase